jgi:hypothetical protein
VAIVATLVLAISLPGLDPIERGIAITIVTFVLLLAVEGSAPGGGIARLLSHPVVTYLGQVSYGTYLWHWPFIVLVGMEVSLEPVPLAVLTCVIATGLAAMSYHLLERPVRRSRWLDLRPSAVIAGGLAISLVSGLVLVPVVLGVAPETPIDVDWRAAKDDNPPLPDCGPDDIAGCTVVHGPGPHVLLLGDSNARMYIPAFTELARQADLTLSVGVGPLCPWPRGLYYLKGGPDCRTNKAFWYGALMDEVDPDLVVLGQRPIDDPANSAGVFAPAGRFDPGSPGYDAAVEEVVRSTVAALRADGRAVVMIEPIPIASRDGDPLSCLSSAPNLDACTYEANDAPTPIELVYRSEADEVDTWSLDIDDLVCPRLPTCDPVVDGIIVKRDSNHITGTYSAHLAAALATRLRAEGILD